MYNLTLTEAELRNLLVLTELGANIWESVNVDEDADCPYLDLQEKLCEIAAENKPAWIDSDEEGFIPGEEITIEASDKLDDYDDVTFWEELVERMAEKEAQKETNQNQQPAKFEELYLKLSEKFETEVEANGLNNLSFKK